MHTDVRKNVRWAANFILSYIFPKEPIIEYLEGLEPVQFEALCSPAKQNAELWISSIFDFENSVVKTAIHEVKYMKNERISRLFIDALRAKLAEYMNQTREKTIIVPIPARPKRMKQYGFNQNELILTACKIPFEDVLVRIKDGESQTGLDAKRRKVNVAEAFALHEAAISLDKIQNSFIILFDDVATTGATLSEARKVLLQAGAKEVIAVTLAN